MISLQILPTLFFRILCPFYGMAQGLITTSNDAQHPGVRHTKGGRQLTGIQYA